jgi:glyoxylase I family protein
MSPQYSFEHIGLAAQDTTALKDWYERVLDARVIYTSAESPPAYCIELAGGARIEIYQGNYAAKEVSDNKLQGWRHIALYVESIDTAKRELESRGVHFTEAPKPAGGGGCVLFFQDPERNLLHLIERPSDSVLRR